MLEIIVSDIAIHPNYCYTSGRRERLTTKLARTRLFCKPLIKSFILLSRYVTLTSKKTAKVGFNVQKIEFSAKKETKGKEFIRRKCHASLPRQKEKKEINFIVSICLSLREIFAEKHRFPIFLDLSAKLN